MSDLFLIRSTSKSTRSQTEGRATEIWMPGGHDDGESGASVILEGHLRHAPQDDGTYNALLLSFTTAAWST
jgi:hypothetical protein